MSEPHLLEQCKLTPSTSDHRVRSTLQPFATPSRKKSGPQRHSLLSKRNQGNFEGMPSRVYLQQQQKQCQNLLQQSEDLGDSSDPSAPPPRKLIICGYGCVYDIDTGLLGGWVPSTEFGAVYAMCAGGRGIGCVSMLDKGERLAGGEEVICGSVGLNWKVKKLNIVFCYLNLDFLVTAIGSRGSYKGSEQRLGWYNGKNLRF